jgi:hypothetical protein
VKTKKSGFNTSNADLSTDILDIMDKPDMAVWNKIVRTQYGIRRRLKIGPLYQNLIREDKNDVIDSANKKAVADVTISGTKVTGKVDLSKSKSPTRRPPF